MKTTLYYKDGSSDKVYSCEIQELNDKCTVNFALTEVADPLYRAIFPRSQPCSGDGMFSFTETGKFCFTNMTAQPELFCAFTNPGQFHLSPLREVILLGHVRAEILHRRADLFAGFVESNHAANVSHGPHDCRLILGSFW
jgi:hypothetical protein